MIGDWEIWACASKLIHLYGEDAAAHALARADALLAEGDATGASVWCRIARRIREFSATAATADLIH